MLTVAFTDWTLKSNTVHDWIVCTSSADAYTRFFGFLNTNSIWFLHCQTKKEMILSFHLLLNVLPFSCVYHSCSYPTCTAGICWRRAAGVGELYTAWWLCDSNLQQRKQKQLNLNTDLSAVWLESVMWMLSWQSQRSRNQLHVVSGTTSYFIFHSFTDYVKTLTIVGWYVQINALRQQLKISKPLRNCPLIHTKLVLVNVPIQSEFSVSWKCIRAE